MNFLQLIAFGAVALILQWGISTSGNPKVFLDIHALVIVFGGTLAAAAISMQLDRLLFLSKVFVKKILSSKKDEYKQLIAEMMRLDEIYRNSADALSDEIKKLKDPFIKDALTLALDGLLTEKDLARVLSKRVETVYTRYSEDASRFAVIAKYPPALALVGTSLSMISLLGKLGEPGAQKMLGPAMALGLVATFWGVAVSNMILSPIADNLKEAAKEQKLRNTIVVEGVKLILRKTSPVVLAEELNSYLLPSERIDWKKQKK